MRLAPLAVLVFALALVPAVAGQPTFTEDFQVRAAVGDIPTTPATEQAGVLNIEQSWRVQFDNASNEASRTYLFRLPAGSTLANATCDCARSTHSIAGNTLSFRIEPQTLSGQRTIRIVTTQPAGDVMGARIAPTAAGPMAFIVYAPTGTEVDANVDLDEVGRSTDGRATILYTRLAGSSQTHDVWFSIHPETEAADPVTTSGEADWVSWLLPALLGLALGAILWSMLVSRGVVQKRSRKQVAATAAHVEAAATESPAVLEGRKRALLAALKEVELARQANEMPVEVYDTVKADLKKQAVTVMRALEARQGAEG